MPGKRFLLETLCHAKGVAFDFDGVVLDSVDIKTDAFAALFQNRPEHLDAIVAYHKANGGISRFVKFRYFYEELFHEAYTDAIEAELGERFNAIVFEKVMNCPEIPGALRFIEELAVRSPLAVISGTPKEELDQIVEGRKLKNFFQLVVGAPTSKENGLRLFAEQIGCKPEELLFFGDATTDYKAAHATGAFFIGVVQEGHISPFPEETPLLSSFLEVGF